MLFSGRSALFALFPELFLTEKPCFYRLLFNWDALYLEDQLLVSLEYIREYRTYFHIGKSYGISESAAYKTVKWVEDTITRTQGSNKK